MVASDILGWSHSKHHCIIRLMKQIFSNNNFLSAFILSSSLLAGCGLIYKADVQQGSVIDSEDIERLEPGLTKRQVIVLLGTPSISDPFHQDRWDYVSSYSRRGQDITRNQLLLTFENDELVTIEGDYLDSLTLAVDAADALTNGRNTLPNEPSEPINNQPSLPTTPSDGDGSGS